MRFTTVTNWPEYQVSPEGVVRRNPAFSRFPDADLRTLKPATGSKEYAMVSFYRAGVQRTKNIHRLVAETFIPNPRNLPQINHRDGNKLNNHVSNLEWVTARENTLHAVSIGTAPLGNRNGSRCNPQKRPRGQSQKKCRLTEEKVRLIRNLRLAGVSLRVISDHIGANLKTVHYAATGKTWGWMD